MLMPNLCFQDVINTRFGKGRWMDHGSPGADSQKGFLKSREALM
jgi:hypothetical protein